MAELLAGGAKFLGKFGLNYDQRMACSALTLTSLQSVASAEADLSPGHAARFVISVGSKALLL